MICAGVLRAYISARTMDAFYGLGAARGQNFAYTPQKLGSLSLVLPPRTQHKRCIHPGRRCAGSH
ncbi:hypothetical protein CNECB9_3760082 [Cupriavidus necator]|uniref:Uncharacterized protein n=1 Tax=Cupriavidus necator TaxID=106590 RepID=A0A1K0IW56_CUPNE|nr:hypothetical protein CNECB9_3760082 [Cupriavidus necator]